MRIIEVDASVQVRTTTSILVGTGTSSTVEVVGTYTAVPPVNVWLAERYSHQDPAQG